METTWAARDWVWLLGGVALGASAGVIIYLADAFDGSVDMVFGLLHRPVLASGLALLALETLAWALRWAPSSLVVGGLLGILAQLITALATHLALPVIKAFLPKATV